MKRPRWIPIAALVLFALLLGGCINIQQEYWLYEDGSAKVGMDIGMSQALISMGASSGSDANSNPFEDLKSEFNDNNPNIKNVQVREYSDDDLQHFAVTFEVDDFEKFLATEASQGSEFNITLTRTPDDSILFKQITQLDTGMGASDMDMESMGPVFKDMYWSVLVHVPRVISTNGEQLDNNTVQWKIPMADIFAGKAPGELTMVYRPKGTIGGGGILGGAGSSGSNWGVWLIAGIVLLVVAAGAAYYFLVWRKRPAAVATTYGGYPPLGDYPPPGNSPPTRQLPARRRAAPSGRLSAPVGCPTPTRCCPAVGRPTPTRRCPAVGRPTPTRYCPAVGCPTTAWRSSPGRALASPVGSTPTRNLRGISPTASKQQQPPQQPPAQYNQAPPQSPDYPAYPQYDQSPQYPPGPVQGSDYYPPYPPQKPPTAPPPAEPPPDQADQG